MVTTRSFNKGNGGKLLPNLFWLAFFVALTLVLASTVRLANPQPQVDWEKVEQAMVVKGFDAMTHFRISGDYEEAGFSFGFSFTCNNAETGSSWTLRVHRYDKVSEGQHESGDSCGKLITDIVTGSAKGFSDFVFKTVGEIHMSATDMGSVARLIVRVIVGFFGGTI